jgi:hypothetical protein
MTRAALVLLLVTGCGAGAAFPPEWVGTDAARRTGLMSGESVPGELDQESLVEEASLVYHDAESSCFDVRVRSGAEHDAAIGDLSSECGPTASSRPHVTGTERVSVFDYRADGELEVAQTEGTPAEGFAAADLDPPAGGAIRVIERSARVCCTVPTGEVLTLSIGAPAVGSVRFEWRMRE